MSFDNRNSRVGVEGQKRIQGRGLGEGQNSGLKRGEDLCVCVCVCERERERERERVLLHVCVCVRVLYTCWIK